MPDIVLASASETRKAMLQAAGVTARAIPANIDETAVLESLRSSNASPRDCADTLAELKAVKVSRAHPGHYVLGADQILECAGAIFEKAATRSGARDALKTLRGREHTLYSAAVLAWDGAPIWRHVSQARLRMRAFSDEFLEWYLAKAGPVLTASVGAYAIEGLGAQLIERIEGDAFTIQGLPLLPLLEVLRANGVVME
jgi:septum formation protein